MSTFKISNVEVLGTTLDATVNWWTTLGFELMGINHRIRVPSMLLQEIAEPEPEPEPEYEDDAVYVDANGNHWLYCDDSLFGGERGWTTFGSDIFFGFSTPERPLRKIG
jgi:hypothetical protein